MVKISKIFFTSLFFVLFFNFLAYSTAVEGDWFYYNDAGNKGKSKIVIDGKETLAFNFIKETINGVEKNVAVLAGVVTTDYVYGFIGMGVKPNGETIKKLKKAKGIKFMVVGDGKNYRCKFDTSNVKDYNCFNMVFSTSKQPQQVTIPYSGLNQESWGQKVSFDLSLLQQIQFQTIDQPQKSVNLKIWDIEIIE